MLILFIENNFRVDSIGFDDHAEGEMNFSAVSAPPIGDMKAAITLESATSTMNQIQHDEMEKEKEKEMEKVYHHDKDMLIIADIVPPTGGIMDECLQRDCKLCKSFHLLSALICPRKIALCTGWAILFLFCSVFYKKYDMRLKSFTLFLHYYLPFSADGSCILLREDENMTALSPSYELIDRIASSNQDVQIEQSQHAESVDSNTVLAAESAEVFESGTKFAPSSSGSPVKKVDKNKVIGDVTKKPAVKLMTLEERGEGAVGWNVYQSYFQAANKPLLLVCLMLSFFLGK